MKFFPIILIFSIYHIIFCVHDDDIVDSFPIENDIMVLTDSTFDQAIKKYENIFVTFYAPWCGHCQKLLPELEKVAKILSQENIIIAKVDATKEKKLSRKHKITSYPTLKFSKEGTWIKYIGPRTQNDLISWARKKAAPPVILLKTFEETEKLKNDNNIIIVYFGKEEKDMKIFKTLAIKYDNIPFVNIEDEKLAQMYKVVPRSVVVFKKFDEKRNDIINFDKLKLEKFIKKHSEPKILSLTQENVALIFNQNKQALVYFGKKEDKRWNKHASTLEKIAFNLDTDLLFVMTEIKEGYGKNVAEKIKLRNNELPCIMILDVKVNIDKYKYTGNFEYEDLKLFIDKWEKGELNKYLRSQKEPKHNNGNVYILVGNTFKRDVIENDDDVIVLFYNPVDNENMRMLKLYDEVAAKLVELNPDLIIAKMDMSENEIDSYVIRGYPTIKFFPGNKKYNSPPEFRGAHRVKDIIAFIKKHAFHKIKTDDEVNSDL